MSKPSVFFIPGWGFSNDISALFSFLVPSCTWIAKPLPSISKELDETKMLDKIIQQLAARMPENSVVVAWSLGGLLAILLCHYYPERIKSLILIASSPRFSAMPEEGWPGVVRDTQQKLIAHGENDLPGLLEYFTRICKYPTHARKDIRNVLSHYQMDCEDSESKDDLLFYLRLMFNLDLRSVFASLTVPITLIHGDQDPVINSEWLQLPIAKQHSQHLIHGAGHVPFLTHEQQFQSIFKRLIP